MDNVKDYYTLIASEIGEHSLLLNEDTVKWLEYYHDKQVPFFVQLEVVKKCIPVGNFSMGKINDIFANEEMFLSMCRETLRKHKTFRAKVWEPIFNKNIDKSGKKD